MALRAKLTLDDVYTRFRADMFLSSLAESGTYTQGGEMLGANMICSDDHTHGLVGRFTSFHRVSRHVGDAIHGRKVVLGAHELHRTPRARLLCS